MACDHYYRKMNCPAVFEAEHGYKPVRAPSSFKDDRELLAYLLRLERQFEQEQRSPKLQVGQRR